MRRRPPGETTILVCGVENSLGHGKRSCPVLSYNHQFKTDTLPTQITDAVHAKGSFIFCQIWSLGRAADITSLREEDPPLPYTAPSPIRLTGKEETPRELTVEEIREYVRMYAEGASKAVYEGGFDGVEIHGANGYQIDQFIQDVSNQRTDEYGGSIENRVRFALEVIDAVVEAVGAERTGFRVSPWAPFQGKFPLFHERSNRFLLTSIQTWAWTTRFRRSLI